MQRTDVAGVVDGGVLADAQPQLKQHDARYVYQLLRAALEVPVLPQVSGQRACKAPIATWLRAHMLFVVCPNVPGLSSLVQEVLQVSSHLPGGRPAQARFGRSVPVQVESAGIHA